MHELSLASSIIEDLSLIASNNKAKKVTEVRLLIGEISGINPESLKFCFSIAGKDTVVDGAKLIIEKVPIEIHCLNCKKKDVSKIDSLFCKKCKSTNIEILTGKEFQVKNMEIEYV